jgi:hypothetical protein
MRQESPKKMESGRISQSLITNSKNLKGKNIPGMKVGKS